MAEQEKTKTIADYIREYENDPEFVAEGLALKITEEALAYMKTNGLNQSWLAEKMGVSRTHVSRIFSAAPNMTLLTVAKIAVALGMEPDIRLTSRSVQPHAVEQEPRAQRHDRLPVLREKGKTRYSARATPRSGSQQPQRKPRKA